MKTGIISQRVDIIKSYGEVRDSLDEAWYIFFEELGTTIFPAPNNRGMLLNEIERIIPDFIILSGGNNPVEYGGEAPQRDYTDDFLISYAKKMNIPLLGVCRGMQSLALYFGGDLVPISNHIAVKHSINGEINRIVNSFHGYAVRKPNNKINVLATSEDGSIEAISIYGEKSMHGIMWHPERSVPFDKDDISMITKWLEI